MAPKKNKSDAHSIGSKLALVIKSGKVVLGYRSVRILDPRDQEKILVEILN